MADERHDGMKMACMFIFMTMMIFRFKTTTLLLFKTCKTDIFGMIHPEAMVMMRDSGHQQHCQCRETHNYFGYPCPHFSPYRCRQSYKIKIKEFKNRKNLTVRGCKDALVIEKNLSFVKKRRMGSGYSFIKQMGGVLREEGRQMMDILIPRECLVCGKKLHKSEKYLCIYCESGLPLTYYWERRNNPMSSKLNEIIQKNLTDNCLENESIPTAKFSYATALFFYHGEAGYKRIPQHLKYMGDFGEGAHYSGMLGNFMKDSPLYRDIDLIIPVPLHWARHWNRGYNQAEVIARKISEALGGVAVRTDILVRSHYTRTQTKLGVLAKSDNVHGAFALRRETAAQVSGCRHILIVDDVFTTGATMGACICMLLKFFDVNVRISCATLGYVTSG